MPGSNTMPGSNVMPGSNAMSGGHGETAGVHRSITEVTTSPRRLPVGIDVPRPGAGPKGPGNGAPGGKNDAVFESKFYKYTHI